MEVDSILNFARAYVGVTQGSAKHKEIVDTYNAMKPLPVGYKMTYTDDWCACFVSFVGIKTGTTSLIGRECGVERFIKIFQSMGIWDENGSKTPKAGDIITFNWNDSTQENDGFADHIGFVEKVVGSTIHTIEGNSASQVKRKTYPVGYGYIRGYARPKYKQGSGTSTEAPADSTKKVTVLKHASHWSPTSGAKKMADFVKESQFKVLKEQPINYSHSNREYLIADAAGALGWVLSQDIQGGHGSDKVGKPSAPSAPKYEILPVDGDLAEKTAKRWQEYRNMAAKDGEISHQWKEKYNQQITACKFDKTLKGSALIRKEQELLKKKGLYTGKIDGLAGRLYITASQTAFGTPADGFVTYPSEWVKALQKALNANKLPY